MYIAHGTGGIATPSPSQETHAGARAGLSALAAQNQVGDRRKGTAFE